MEIRETSRHEGKNELPMAPMIDIVFQLLIFFIMTFKIVAMEGDFHIKMPLGGGGEFDEWPMMIELQSDSQGNVADIVMKRPSGDVSLGPGDEGFQKLNEQIIAYIGTGAQRELVADSTKIIFDCDEFLRYEEAVKAITAVSGYVENDQLVTLVERVQFRDHGE